MAINKFYYKSLSELQELAQSFRTRLSPGVQSAGDPVYTIDDVSKQEFDNIATFLQNSSVKDAKLIQSAESELSRSFSSLLAKYLDQELGLGDIVSLRNMVKSYNDSAFTHMYNNLYGYVFGIRQEGDIEPTSATFFGRMVSDIKSRIDYLVSRVEDRSEKKTAEEWFTGSAGTSTTLFTAREFFDGPLQRSNIVETVVLLSIISYANKDELGAGLGGAFVYDGSSVVREGMSLSDEDFFSEYDLITEIKDLQFSSEEAAVIDSEVGVNTRRSIRISDDNGKIVLTVPYLLLDSEEDVIEEYNFLSVTGSSIDFIDLIEQLRSNLFSFINQIKIDLADRSSEYSDRFSYFENEVGDEVLLRSINSDARSIGQSFFLKDTIVESARITTGSSEKLSASQQEITSIQSQNQLVFIDVKDVDFSGYSGIELAQDAFGDETLGDANIDYDGSDETSSTYRLTYTLLYKETNQALRPLLLSDVQEYVFARVISQLGKSTIFQADSGGISYSQAIETTYRIQTEGNELLRLSPELSRYRFFYGNGYNARKFAESEIIGYYVGDGSSEADFTNNYGRYDYQKREIASFLEVYRTSRDYYYRVLLNKSFLQDSAYPLYERMFIGWTAIERFLSSKISNLRDPDFFNDQDIFNFLESYGLGVLNQYDFSLPTGRNYKTNIIKYFNQLTRLKGSKDVIPLLARVFDVDDTTLEINKYLLVDAAGSEYEEVDSYELGISDVGSGKLNVTIDSADTGITVYDPDRIYYHGGSFKKSDGTSATSLLTGITYVFDEERGVLYSRSGSTISAVAYTLTNRVPVSLGSGQIVLNELTEKFYTGTTPAEITTIERFSLVDTMPAATTDRTSESDRGSIYYISGDSKFYEKIAGGWLALKVSSDYPSVISENIGLRIPENSQLSATLSSYDGNYFYTLDPVTGEPDFLIRYSFSSNTVERLEAGIDFTSAASLPKAPNEIDARLSRVLIKESIISRSYLTVGQPIEYAPMAYILETTETGNKRSVDISDRVRDIIALEDEASETLMVQPRNSVTSPNIRFIEVPYSSDNGTREIRNALTSGVPYEDFVSMNVAEGIDPYWTLDNVPESLFTTDEDARRINVNAVETKYISITISENVYRNYVVSRYLLSAIEMLESKFILDAELDGSTTDDEPVTSRILIDSGSELFGAASLYDFLQAVKILFKANILLFSAQAGDSALRGYDSTLTKYYGINKDANWSNVEDAIERVVPGFDSIKTEFLTEVYKTSNLTTTSWTGATSYDKFNLYQKTNNPVDFSGEGLRAYKKDLVTDGAKQLNDVADSLRNYSFSSLRFSPATEQKNSGQLTLDIVENLNPIRIEEAEELWSYFLSKYFDIEYNNLEPGRTASQVASRLPEDNELYYQIIEDAIKFPIQMFDGLLNESYASENRNLTKDFVDFATAIFEEVYTQDARKNWEFANSTFADEQPATGSKGEYFYNTDDDELFIYNGSSWGSALTIEATGTHGLTTPANSSGTNGDYFLNITNDILYLKVTGVWTAQSFTFGDIFVDTTEERVIVCLPEDPSFYTKTSFENSSVQSYLEGALNIVNGVTEIPSAQEEIDALSEEYVGKLISVVESFESIFSSEEFMRVRLSLRESEQRTIGFVETTARLFLSYTSQLYASRFRREYNTAGESAPLSEKILHTVSVNRADYALYDEQITIEKED